MRITGPGYWMHETSGELRPAVLAYLEGEPLTDAQVTLLRAYLRQWIASPLWAGPDIEPLRAGIEALTSREAIRQWLRLAERGGIDPL